MMRWNGLAAMIVSMLWSAASGMAMDWPQWRGPFFNGSTDASGLPASWSKDAGIAWVSPLPGPSGATPVITGDRVFVTSTVKGTPEFVALCFDATTGKMLWRREVGSDARRFPRNNMASPSPVTDGKRVFFLYGDGTLVGFDVEGEQLWSRAIEKEYGNLALQFGYSSSPLLHEDKLYVVVFRRDTPYRGHPGIAGPLDSFILAVDPSTGRTLWRQSRKTDAFDEGMETYMTPIPFARDGKVELLTTGGDFITSHDPQTGKELWRFEYWTRKIRDSRIIPTLVAGDGLIFGTRHKHQGVFALEPPTRDGQGGRILWDFDAAAPDCSTPLFYNGRLYVLDGLKRKIVTSIDPRTGKQFWQGRLPGARPWWASLTAGDGKLYCINEDGQVVVLQAGGDEFKILFETTVGESPIQSSIAIANDRLFIRTAENLYCVGR